MISIAAGDHRARVLARRDELVLAHLSLAEGIARNVARSLPPSFDVEDLIGTANVALMRAATRYQPRTHGGTPFSAYARLVVRGAVIESVRRNRYVENTRPGLYGLQYSDCGPREEYGLREDYESAALEAVATQPTAPQRIDAGREARRVAEAATWLPERQRRVLAAFYTLAEPSLVVVAETLGITHSQAKEAHAAAIRALRARLKRAA